MADRWEAQYQFWSSFGVPAYEENSVPTDAPYPRITFPKVSAPFNGRTLISPSIWTRSPSWLQADTLSDAIQGRLKYGGKQIFYDGGFIWFIAEENGFATSMGDPNDDMVKRYRLAVICDFS